MVTGGVVSPHYDPMLAKVIAHAPTRTEAVAALAATLAGSRIHGVTTNRDLLVRTLRHEGFAAGDIDTGFLDRHDLDVLAAPLADEGAVGRHAVAAALAGQAERRAAATVLVHPALGLAQQRGRPPGGHLRPRAPDGARRLPDRAAAAVPWPRSRSTARRST